MIRYSTLKYGRPVFWFVVVLLISLVIADVVIVSQQRKLLMDIRQKDVRNEVNIIGALVQETLLKHDYGTVENFLIQWGNDHPDVLEIRAITPNNFVLADYKSTLPMKYFFRVQHKVIYEGEPLATIVFAKDFSIIEKNLDGLSFKLIGGSVAFISLLGFFLWYTLTITAMKPLEEEISERKKTEGLLKQSNEFSNTILNSINDSISIIDVNDFKLISVNHFFLKEFGFKNEEDVIGKTCHEITHHLPDICTPPNNPCPLLETLSAGDQSVMEHMHYTSDNKIHHVEVSTAPIRDAQGKIIQVVHMERDITERKKAEEQLKYDALHDTLTGLPNRALFMDRLKHAIAIAERRADYFFSVLFVDLDRFKVVNDSLGHIIGDQLLISLGQKLSACLRPGDTIARLGGDEFAILLEDIGDLKNAIIVSKRIQNKLAAPFHINDKEIFTTASIGIALGTPGYVKPEDLLRDADTAMYQAKANGRANYVLFESGMHIQAVERLQLDTDLRNAVGHKEFIAYYQPILSIETKRIVGYEALVRWKHPERGILFPADFMQAAEETGLIVDIDRTVLRDACIQMHLWQMQFPGSSDIFMSVNLSNKQMSRPDLVDYIAGVLKETGLNPKSLKLEITENVIIEDPEATSAMLGKLRDLGVLIYIDDFGTGYSSLSYLHRLPIDGLKIDRSFIRRLGETGENQEIIKTIMLLAKDINVKVIAEGIETENQLTQLTSLNCEYWQGYLCSKPVGSEEAGAFIAAESSV